ncbi:MULTISPECIES: hypothetical protein [unclassified Pseudomonas]|uniref:hypothetical protein n=1 Tax=unclassified Pseudomonas TaxID=196821 RepID=UPI000C8820D9|nr:MULTISPECIES: hypothetical protein [unclassified Pseudomonas]PNA03503.1 hypothetical protein C1X28_19850 [Pseudomonas sp. FW305-BF15]PNB79309.1 hypothetical protein C1X30_18360 [Pseudomonas sp. FW305-BF6]
MNFDQAKSIRLQRWRATLDDHEFRLQNPEGHRESLHEMAEALHAEGLIDQLEQFDMNEMADAAYWHAVEELQNSPGQYRGASTYDVVHVDDGKLLATISRSIFNFATEKPRGASRTYDGKVYSSPEGIHLSLGISRNVGTISGLTLEMHGQRYHLIETERVIRGVDYQPIDDPDAYRALVDAGQVAQEERDLRAFEKVRPHIESAVFCTCPACLDRFGARDDCQTCTGKGFVTKPAPAGLR